MRDDERASSSGDRLGDIPDIAEIPVAELSDERRVEPRVRGPKSRRVAAAFLAVAVGIGGAVVATRSTGRHRPGSPKPGVAVSNVDDAHARVDVYSALKVTTGSGSFHIRYRLSETPAPASSTTTSVDACGGASNGSKIPVGRGIATACGYGMTSPNNVTISGDGVVTVSPTAMVTSANVPGFGVITTRVNGTDVWEDGGGYYGMTSGSGTGAGAPLSQFAPLVLGTLGQREGAIAMAIMASPTGYLDLAQQSITASSSLGDSEVDGVPTRDYKVTLDSNRDDRPGLTAEEAKTAAAARTVLEREGFTTTVVVLSIDGLGFIRRAQTTVMFSDGGTVDADTTFSDFGCARTVIGPAGPEIVPDPAGCASPASVTTTVPATAPPVTVAPTATTAPTTPTVSPPATTGTATTAPPAPDTTVSVPPPTAVATTTAPIGTGPAAPAP
ncbi:MAG: hypothetical protein QOI08_1731 [Actinomycetota bacterium]|nr:hypothetical protein [Actinomycetota bacterium]